MNATLLQRPHRILFTWSLLLLVTSLCGGSKGLQTVRQGEPRLPLARKIEVPGKGIPFSPSLSHNGDYLSFRGVDVYVFDTRDSHLVATHKGGIAGFLPGDRFFVNSLFNVKFYEKDEWTNPSNTIWVKPKDSNPGVGPYADRISFSGNGRWFVVARAGRLIGRTPYGPVDIELYEVDTREMRIVAHYDAVQVVGLALSQDGGQVAIGYASKRPRIEILDVQTGNVRDVLELRPYRKNFYGGKMRFSPDGSWLASTFYDAKLRLWHLGETSSRARIESKCGTSGAFAFSPSSKHLVVGCPQQPPGLDPLSIWSLPDCELAQSFAVNLPLSQGGLAISGDGKYLAVAELHPHPAGEVVFRVIPFESLFTPRLPGGSPD